MHPALRKEPLFFTKKHSPFSTFLQKKHFPLFQKTPPFFTFLQNTPIFHFFYKKHPHFISAYGPVLTLTSSLII